MNFELEKKRGCLIFSFKYKLLLAYFFISLFLLKATAQTSFSLNAKSKDSLLKSIPAGASAEDKIEFITLLISEDSTQGVYYEKRAEAYSAAHEDIKALQDLEKALSIGYTDSNFYALLGFTASRAGKWERAVMYLTEAINENPENEMLYAYRGYANMTIGEYAMAENDYFIYLKHHQEDGISWFGMAQTEEGLGKHDSAITSFKKSIELDSTNYEAYFDLGIIYCNKNEFSKAIADFDACLKIKPDLPYVYFNRGKAKARNHQPFCDDFKKCVDMHYTPGIDMYDKFCGGK